MTEIAEVLISNSFSLSHVYHNRLINKVKNTFTTEEQSLFITSFYCYLNRQPTEFCIDLDKLWTWLGFTQKKSAKQLLEKHFIKGQCYIVQKDNSFERSGNKGGHNNEVILMSVETFKHMCMMCKTAKGGTVRKYYTKLEHLLQETIDEETNEMRLELDKSKTLLETTQHALDLEKEKYKQALKRKYYGHEPSQAVYIFIDNPNDPKSMIKIGKTTNVAIRESHYQTCTQTGQMMFCKKCYNCDLLEKMVHHMMDKYRYMKDREWFETDLETAKYVIECAQMFLDDFIPIIDKLPETNIKEFIEDVITNSGTRRELIKEQKETIYKKVVKEQEEIHQQVFEKTNEDVERMDLVNPLDFTKFITDCCERGEDFYCIKNELYAAHKLWSRSSDTKKKIFEYFQKEFKPDKMYFEEYKATLAIFRGLKLKDYKPVKEEDKCEYADFVRQECKVGYLCRITNKNMYEQWVKWKSNKVKEYVFDINEKKKFNDWMAVKFFPVVVHISDAVEEAGKGNNSHGLWGVTIKEDQTTTGLKISKVLRKRIAKIDNETKKLVTIYGSLAEASKENNIYVSTLWSSIKFKKPRDGFLYKQLD